MEEGGDHAGQNPSLITWLSTSSLNLTLNVTIRLIATILLILNVTFQF